MKKVHVFFLMIFIVLGVSVTVAEEKAPLGSGNVAMKIDYIYFTDDAIKNSNINSGLYLGIESYGHIGRRWYLGGEVGYANPTGSFTSMGIPVDAEVIFIPVEVNVKRAIARSTRIISNVGFGLSMNFVEQETIALGNPLVIDDALWGVQIFGDYNYSIDNFIVGLKWKYQITDKFDDKSYRYNNWRFGVNIGYMF